MNFKFRLIVTQGYNRPGGNWITVTEYMIARSENEVRTRFNDDMRNKINGREIRHIYNEGNIK